jgi:hypothetical protein
MAEYDRFAQEVGDHLEDRNVLGLSAHKQYAANLADLDKKRQTYLGQIKAIFDSRREAINRFLDMLKVDRRVTTAFNPMSSDACYAEIYERGAAYIQEAAILRPLDELDAQERELLYARDILSSLEPQAADLLLARIRSERESLSALGEKVDAEWVKRFTHHGSKGDMSDVVQPVDSALTVVREARQVAREAARPALPGQGASSSMYELIDEKGSTDLKEIVLRMMSGSTGGAQLLDECLASLVELFRANCIRIRVERQRN